MSASEVPPRAQWTIELHADCPACKEYVDLLQYADFWDGRGKELQTGQNKENVEVVCPECGHEFIVDCVY